MKHIIAAIVIAFASLTSLPVSARHVVPKPGDQWHLSRWCKANDAKGIAAVRRALESNSFKEYIKAIKRKDTTCVDLRYIPLPPERVIILKGLFLIRHNDKLCGQFFLSETRYKVKLVFWVLVPCPLKGET